MDTIENIYSLSPLQQGLLFHSVYEPQSRVYQQQLSLRIDGPFDTAAALAAWRTMIERHAVLRTAILWEDLDDAYQVVLTEVPVPLTELDWRDRTPCECAVRDLEISEREALLDLSAPPLMRLCLVRLGEASWQMIWTHHHIVLDGWSEGIVLSDWLACYRAFCTGQTPQLSPTRPFQDYVAWLAEQDEGAAEAYWRSKLGAITEPTPLPRLGARPGIQDSTLPYAEQSLVLSRDDSERLTSFARAQRITLNTLVQASWARLLGAYAGRENALFGITLGGRPEVLTHSEAMVGLFINTLPLNVEWHTPLSIGDWLRQLQADVAELRQYEYSALSRLKSFSGIRGDLPLFEAILVFENFPLDASLSEHSGELSFKASDGDVRTDDTDGGVDDVRLSQGRNNYPLSLIAIPSGDAFEFTLSYARETFSNDQVRLMLRQFQALLRALTLNADLPVDALTWVSDDEQQRLLEWGTGSRHEVPAIGLHQLFERQVDSSPDADALVVLDGRLSYRTLERRANQLAHFLLAQGIKRGDFIALALERSTDFVVSVLATLKCGAAYVPLDLKQPAARLDELVRDAGARLVISHSDRTRQLELCGTALVCLDAIQSEFLSAPESRLQITVTPDCAAYMIYTSGSTGTPKGVVMPHAAIVDYVTGILAALTLPSPSRFGMVSTVAADLGHTQLFGALSSGGSLILADEDTAFNPVALAAFMSRSGVDVLKLTPSHLRGLLDACASADLLPRHTLILGGEAVSGELVRRVRDLMPDLHIVNHYGPTETAVGAAYQRVPEVLDQTATIPLGQPLPNRHLYVLDEHRQVVPAGVPGELYIGGAAIARGYLNRPELNAHYFLDDPFVSGQRMYRSGDRVCWMANGTLEFLGRVDSQVKIRGHRVELGEVEAQVRRLTPQIREVVARLVQLPEQAPRLVAYVVADGSLNVEKLRDDLGLRVPEYLVPAAFILLDTIPLNANGKPDHKQLPLPSTQEAADGLHSPTHVAPRNEVERTLAAIWQSVLNVQTVGIQDNFFSLGGDSILNLQIIARAGQAGLKLTPRQLFEHRTVAELAAVLGADGAHAQATASPTTKAVPLTPGQRARLASGFTSATWRCLQLSQQPEAEALAPAIAQALQFVQRHHRALQMGLQHTGSGEWQQVLLSSPQAPTVSRHTLSTALTSDDRQDALEKFAADALQELDLAKAQSLRACLLQSGNTTQLLLVAHPLVLDEAAWPVLLRNLSLALSQVLHKRPVALTPMTSDFLVWAEQQQRRAEGDELDDAWEHWLEFAGAELPALPVQQAATTKTIRLPASVSQQLVRLKQQMQLSWEGLFATALGSLLHEALPQADRLLLGLQTGRPDQTRLPNRTGRDETLLNASEIVGALAHDAPVFLKWNVDTPPLEQLRDVETQLAAQPGRSADYGVLRYLSDNSYLLEPLQTVPRPQVSLAWLGDWDAHCEPHGVLGAVVAAGHATGEQTGLQINAYWQQNELVLECHGALAQDWSARLEQGLQGFAQLPQQPAQMPVSLDWGNIAEVYPLSAMQQGMLMHTQLAPNSGIYLMQERFRWEGRLDREALDQAWARLLERHPVLRTGFTWDDADQPLQFVCNRVASPVLWYDWRGLDPDVQTQQLESLLAAERHEGFNLRQPPLTRLRVFQLGEQAFRLVRSFHHLLSDAWSFNLLIQDLLAIYQAECEGQPVARPLGRPFSDYIYWLARQDHSAAETFWRAELSGFHEPTPLVIDQHKADGLTEAAAEVEISLGVAQTEQLQQRCREHELTANTWLQGAWALLLSRYSGKQDVAFGITVAGRPASLPGAEGILGVFINSLPLRLSIDDNRPVSSWLQQILERNVAVREYEHTPLVDIQQWSEVEPGRALFDSLLVFENAPLDAAEASSGLDFSIDLLEDRGLTNYPLTLTVMPGSRLGLRLSYDSHRFDGAAVERMLGHLRTLLLGMLDAPERPIGELEILTSPERQLMLADWNQTAHDFPLDETYAALFARQVAQHPQQVAAVCQGEALSYFELDQRANRLAHALIAAGAQPDTLVALLAERGLPLLTMMIAVLKAGAAFQPLDINHPPQRLGEVLRLGGAAVVLTSTQSAALLDQLMPALDVVPVCLVAEDLWLADDSNRAVEQPVSSATPDSLAYVIFTSGSTGTPKGAMVEQRGMLNNIYGKIPALGFEAADRLAQTASPAFDISIWQFLTAPLLGATVHILPDAITREPAQLLKAIDDEAITLMEVVPSVIRAMLADCPAEASLTSLRWLMSIGEALPPALCRQWFERFPQVPLLNLYGPAECADNIGYHPITEAPAEICQHMPIGRPTANNQLYILDEALRPLPIGVPGEICTAGMGVGRGYLNDPERTAVAFVAHPLTPGARFYRTGDIGRYQSDGVIEYLGRRDQQVKVRGHRIELGEIENRLSAHPAIQTAVVLAQPDARGETRLIAYWQARTAEAESLQAVSIDALREYLADTLPAYMLPAVFLRLDELPLNANGKLDRKALSQIQIEAPHTHSTRPQRAHSDTEARIVSIFSEVLHLSAVALDDSFFALGGHSLLATQAMSRVRKAFQIDLPLRMIFEHPTVALLARQVDRALAKGGEAARRSGTLPVSPSLIPSISARPRDARLPLSFAQQRLWYHDQLNPGSSVFNIPFALTLSGQLNITALSQSLDYLVARHEVLRTALPSEQGEPWQQILESLRVELPLEDLSALEPASQQAALTEKIAAVVKAPFDLQAPPLIRAALFRLAPETHVLALALHHIAVDDWSFGLLVDDLAQAYTAFSTDSQPELAPLTLQYADFAAWQRQHVSGAFRQQQLDYWRTQLAGCAPGLTLPGFRRNTADVTQPAERYRRELPKIVSEALQRQAEQSGSTLFMVLHAALNVLLHQQTGATDILVGTDIANRHQGETETLVGFFVNQLVLRCRLEPDQSFEALLKQCRHTALEAYQHQDLPFETLVAELLPQRTHDRSPFFQIKLILQNAPQQDLTLDGLTIEELKLTPAEAEFDLLINCVPGPEGLQMLYNYSPNRYEAGYIEQLAALFETLLGHIATAGSDAVAELVKHLDQVQHSRQQQALGNSRDQRDRKREKLTTARRKSVTITLEDGIAR
ncbi:amino acid adenylation domain-containing protein [Allohahella sp. A8]|uniref:amino acid adenylation domain-containing protein n=1 Tax=Allohahella sp. A8 TaxID=3141461 RepID=UPI003A809218